MADMFQQRFPRVDRTTALYRAFAATAMTTTTAFLMIFLRDFTVMPSFDDANGATTTSVHRTCIKSDSLLSIRGQLSVELTRTFETLLRYRTTVKSFSSFHDGRLPFRSPLGPPRVAISFQIPGRDEGHEVWHPRVLNRVIESRWSDWSHAGLRRTFFSFAGNKIAWFIKIIELS